MGIIPRSKINSRLNNLADKLSALDDVDPCTDDYVIVLRNQMLILTGLVRDVLDRTTRLQGV